MFFDMYVDSEGKLHLVLPGKPAQADWKSVGQAMLDISQSPDQIAAMEAAKSDD